MKTILVVDDDPMMRDLITEYLQDQDFRVAPAADGREMGEILAESLIDLVILDLKLSGEDGLQIMRKLRDASVVPIIVITGHRRDEVDRIIGLELGADDYLTKPFSLRELLARIRVIFRRIESCGTMAPPDEKRTKFRFAGWELNLRSRRLVSPTGVQVSLTNGEFNLLTAFLRSPGRVLSREQLLIASRLHEDICDRSIDAQILRLRRKLECDPREPELIKTERGAGYLFAVPVEAR